MIKYGDWTRAIGAHFFRDGLGSSPTYLAFDEAMAAQIGRTFELEAKDFIAAVAAIVDVESDNPFLDAILEDCGVEYPYLGILAAQVYVATEMGSFSHLDRSAYWKPFQDFFTNGHQLRTPALDRLDQFWYDARTFYDGQHRGRLAIQSDPQNVPHVGWRHINLPLWQALLRESDRMQIRQWLREQERDTRDARRVLRDLVADAGNFNRKLAQTLRETTRYEPLSAALEELVRELVTDADSKVHVDSLRAAGRLRLAGRSHLSCFLQMRSGPDEWVDATPPIGIDEVRYGLSDDLSGAVWRGDDRILFLDAGTFVGAVSHRGAVPPDSGITVLFLTRDTGVTDQLGKKQWQSCTVNANLRGFNTAKLKVTDKDESFLSLFGCRLFANHSIRLEAGLHYRSRYLTTNPPLVCVTASVRNLRVDGIVQTVPENGLFRFETPMTPGQHDITAGGETLRFDVEDGSLLEDSPDGEEICLAISRLGVMHTSRIEAVSTTEYLLGGYLGSVPQ